MRPNPVRVFAKNVRISSGKPRQPEAQAQEWSLSLPFFFLGVGLVYPGCLQ